MHLPGCGVDICGASIRMNINVNNKAGTWRSSATDATSYIKTFLIAGQDVIGFVVTFLSTGYYISRIKGAVGDTTNAMRCQNLTIATAATQACMLEGNKVL